MMNELISVIVPVYNVESYVEQCARSVMEQTYRNIELILVDDGSPDKSGEICDRLATEDSRVRVLHKANGGLSDARNFGLAQARGELIAFIDSDDFVAPTYIEYLYSLITQTGADISSCIFLRSGDRSAPLPDDPGEVKVMSGIEACRMLLGSAVSLPLLIANCKLMRKSIVDGIEYPVGRKHEDVATTYKYLLKAGRVAVGTRTLYFYYNNPSGITATAPKGRNEDELWAITERHELLKKHDDASLVRASYANMQYFLYTRSLAGDGYYDPEIAELIRDCRSKGVLPARDVIKCMVYLTAPERYRRLRKRLGR